MVVNTKEKMSTKSVKVPSPTSIKGIDQPDLVELDEKARTFEKFDTLASLEADVPGVEGGRPDIGVDLGAFELARGLRRNLAGVGANAGPEDGLAAIGRDLRFDDVERRHDGLIGGSLDIVGAGGRREAAQNRGHEAEAPWMLQRHVFELLLRLGFGLGGAAIPW